MAPETERKEPPTLAGLYRIMEYAQDKKHCLLCGLEECDCWAPLATAIQAIQDMALLRESQKGLLDTCKDIVERMIRSIDLLDIQGAVSSPTVDHLYRFRRLLEAAIAKAEALEKGEGRGDIVSTEQEFAAKLVAYFNAFNLLCEEVQANPTEAVQRIQQLESLNQEFEAVLWWTTTNTGLHPGECPWRKTALDLLRGRRLDPEARADLIKEYQAWRAKEVQP